MRISDWSSDVCSSDLALRCVLGLRAIGVSSPFRICCLLAPQRAGVTLMADLDESQRDRCPVDLQGSDLSRVGVSSRPKDVLGPLCVRYYLLGVRCRPKLARKPVKQWKHP